MSSSRSSVHTPTIGLGTGVQQFGSRYPGSPSRAQRLTAIDDFTGDDREQARLLRLHGAPFTWTADDIKLHLQLGGGVMHPDGLPPRAVPQPHTVLEYVARQFGVAISRRTRAVRLRLSHADATPRSGGGGVR